jgi:DNA-binding HxlR family transcriptional regulator
VQSVRPRGNIFDVSCESRAILNRIGDRWTIYVITALGDGPMRFTDIRNRIGGVTPKVLTETLRALEGDSLVRREVFEENPPRVEYSLTPVGESLREPLRALCDWAETHMVHIAEACAAYAEETRATGTFGPRVGT